MAALSTAALVTMAAAAGYSAYSAHQQTKMAQKQQKREQAQQLTQMQQIAEEQKKAQNERKGLLTAQRYQMGYDSSYSTSGTSSVGRSITTGESTLG